MPYYHFLVPEESRASLLIACSHNLVFLNKCAPLLAPDLYGIDSFGTGFCGECSGGDISNDASTVCRSMECVLDQIYEDVSAVKQVQAFSGATYGTHVLFLRPVNNVSSLYSVQRQGNNFLQQP
jgi:hypothetical protein